MNADLRRSKRRAYVWRSVFIRGFIDFFTASDAHGTSNRLPVVQRRPAKIILDTQLY